MRAALADCPHVMALKNGSVASDSVSFAWENVNPITRAFRRMVRTGDFDLCEIALTTLAQSAAFGKELTALPVVVFRGFHHAALQCPVASPLRGPEDLPGKRIGVRAFSQTTGVWRWRIRRHFRPRIFARLPAALRQRYADALGVSLEALGRID